MDDDKQWVLDQISNMWYNDLELRNGTSDFESWCDGNVTSEEQKILIDKVKYHVDQITYILSDGK